MGMPGPGFTNAASSTGIPMDVPLGSYESSSGSGQWDQSMGQGSGDFRTDEESGFPGPSAAARLLEALPRLSSQEDVEQVEGLRSIATVLFSLAGRWVGRLVWA